MRGFLERAAAGVLLALAAVAGAQTKQKEAAVDHAAADFLWDNRGFGAVCVSPEGLFLTRCKLPVEDRMAKGKLVLRPGKPDRKDLPVQVVRIDAASGLVLLRADVKRPFPHIELGEDKDILELREAQVFSIPTTADRERPPYEVLPFAVRIASRTLDKGEFRRFAYDFQEADPLNKRMPARSESGIAFVRPREGSPILDPQGKLIGIQVDDAEQTPASGAAIPVGVVRRFIGRPEIILEDADIPRDARFKPRSFRAAISVSDPAMKDKVGMELVLQSGSGPPRRFPMVPDGNSFKVEAAPFPMPVDNADKPRVELDFPNATMKRPATDMEYRVGDTRVRLSETIELRFGKDGGEVRHRDGRVLRGKVEGLDDMETWVGAKPERVPARQAGAIRVSEPDGWSNVQCVLVAKRGTEEIATLRKTLYVEGAPRSSYANLEKGIFLQPGKSTSPVHSLRIRTSPGTYPGANQDLVLADLESELEGIYSAAFRSGDRKLVFSNSQKSLELKTYTDAVSGLDGPQGKPWLRMTGVAPLGARATAQFAVWQLEYAPKANQFSRSPIRKCAIDFVVDGPDFKVKVMGMLRYHSDFE